MAYKSNIKVESLPLSVIRPDPRNPRVHTRDQIRSLAEIIETFGYTQPILVRKDNQIVAGHGRFEACKLLKFEAIPAIRLDHLSDAQATAYMIADNKLTDRSHWDERLLAEHFKELESIVLDFDIVATGFELPEIDILIQSLEPSENSDAADEFETEEGPEVTRAGDLWALGKHRLLCGDALNSTSYTALLGDERAAAVFTDPPYNVRIRGHATGKGKRQHREFAMASGEMSSDAFTTFLSDWLALATAISQPGAVQFMCMDWRHITEATAAIEKTGHEVINLCVWVKNNGGMGSLYRSRHELVFVYRPRGAQHRNNVQLGIHGRNRTNVWHYPGATSFAGRGKNRDASLHPTVKPITMVADALLDVTAPNDVVLDPFMGSGTTLLAAERARRRAYGIELDPQYVDLAIRRWQRMTKQVARLIDGRTFDEVRLARLSDFASEASDPEA